MSGYAGTNQAIHHTANDQQLTANFKKGWSSSLSYGKMNDISE
jgi:hypothetical protein